MAAHYGAVVIPARPRKPRDKAKVEAGVLLVGRWILARLRHRRFFSLAELNQAIRELLVDLNQRPFKKLTGSRRSLFEDLDRPALRLLPARQYEFATWKQATVSIDYHVEVARHLYSVPYQLVGRRLDIRLTGTVVEVFHSGRRVASHRRAQWPQRYTTESAHMPASHRAYLEWTPSRILHWAQQSGPKTAELVDGVLSTRRHPEQGYRACLGILGLGKRYGGQRLEAACARALTLRAFSYRSVESILKTGLDRRPLVDAVASPIALRPHDNLRGPQYYS
jgi:transposase